jgi:polysaccharide biosynthesis/export protein
MHLGRFLRTLLLASLGVACASKGVYTDATNYVAKHPTKSVDAEVIRPRDSVSVRVFGEPNLSADALVVRPTGVIVLPLLGEQQVAGQTTRTLAANVTKALEPYLKDPHVTVILTPAPLVIHVMGEIAATGRKEYRDKVRLPEVLAESGSLTPYASRSQIYVLRGKDRIRFSYQDVLRGQPPARDFWMEDGAFVVVE